LKLSGPWGRVSKLLLRARRDTKKGLNAAIRKEAYRWAREMIMLISRGGPGYWPENSEITVYWKHSRRPLVWSGGLRRAINVYSRGWGRWFCGVPTSARNARGDSYADIAATMEYGHVNLVQTVKSSQIKMFAKLKKAGLMAMIPAIGSTVRPHSPSRPFASPVYEKMKPGMVKRIMKDLSLNILKGAAAEIERKA